METIEKEYDYVIIGSGFGGSVASLRLSEKGYDVLVIEKGKEFHSTDFPKTNWNLRKWLWLPSLRFFGFFKMTFLRHIGILSGVGFGGGSLVYANTLPRPKQDFFNSGNWAGLLNWEQELETHYLIAEKMLGATLNPKLFDSDLTLNELAKDLKRENDFKATNVAVFFGEANKIIPDPYFNGEGPDRSGCTFCGACMTGCRHNAKNTLDKNYLYLARKKGVESLTKRKVISVYPQSDNDGSRGYYIEFKNTTSFIFKKKYIVKTKGVIFSGGVLGTLRLLLNMKEKNLPGLSKQLGNYIRTNNESLILIASDRKDKDFSEGIAIGSIIQVDENSHLEPVRYGKGSGFWRLLGVPLTHGRNIYIRLFKLLWNYLKHPFTYLGILILGDFAKKSVILLFMQHLDSTLQFKKGLFNLKSKLSQGAAPSAFMPEAKDLAEKISKHTQGKPLVLITEALTGIPTTAHILGGAVIGKSPEDGVIDTNHRVFGYKNMYICDGSAISANPGVNPALTITAMTERAMAKIEAKKSS